MAFTSNSEFLNKNRVMLGNKLDAVSVSDHLLQAGLITQNMYDEINSNATKYKKTTVLLDILLRRGPEVPQRFIQALIDTDQYHILDEWNPENPAPRPTAAATVPAFVQRPLTTSIVFLDLKCAIAKMQPNERVSERFRCFITSVFFYDKLAPDSQLGAAYLPYLFALRALKFDLKSVTSWPGCCDKEEFKNLLFTYDLETDELIRIIRSLEKGGIHLKCCLTPDMAKMMRKCWQSHPGVFLTPDDYIEIIINTIDPDGMSEEYMRFIACAFHLICFGNHSFIIRKSQAPKPNCYMLLGARLPSSVIDKKDIEVVREVLKNDESVKEPELTPCARPW